MLLAPASAVQVVDVVFQLPLPPETRESAVVVSQVSETAWALVASKRTRQRGRLRRVFIVG